MSYSWKTYNITSVSDPDPYHLDGSGSESVSDDTDPDPGSAKQIVLKNTIYKKRNKFWEFQILLYNCIAQK